MSPVWVGTESTHPILWFLQTRLHSPAPLAQDLPLSARKARVLTLTGLSVFVMLLLLQMPCYSLPSGSRDVSPQGQELRVYLSAHWSKTSPLAETGRQQCCEKKDRYKTLLAVLCFTFLSRIFLFVFQGKVIFPGQPFKRHRIAKCRKHPVSKLALYATQWNQHCWIILCWDIKAIRKQLGETWLKPQAGTGGSYEWGDLAEQGWGLWLAISSAEGVLTSGRTPL